MRLASPPALAPAWIRSVALWSCLACIVLSCPSTAQEPAVRIVAGRLIERVACAHDPNQTYALYLPSRYTPEQAWPILYCWDPAARGTRPVERFQAAAEQHGWIVVGSNNSRNGSWDYVTEAVNAVLRDTSRRFRIQGNRRYTAGFSGGARAACSVAEQCGMAAVIACGGGFPDSRVPRKVGFAVFAVAGTEDFNHLELRRLDAELASQQAAHRFAVFAGGHEWLPPALAEEALDWLDLQAMKSGRLPPDGPWIQQLLSVRSRAAVELGGLEALRAQEAIVADFQGLVDTTAAAASVKALKGTKAIRRALSAERKLATQEERWIEQLLRAIDLARRPPAQWSAHLARPSATDSTRPDMDAINSAMAPDLRGSSDDSGRPPWMARQEPNLDPADRFSLLRDAVAEVRPHSKDNVAARRALNRAFAIIEQGRMLLEDGRPDEAAICLEAATIVWPEAPDPYYLWARACAAQHDRRQARDLLEQARAKGFKDAARLSALEAELK